jgi:hypothetical protein
MDKKDIITQYEKESNPSFVATEDELKSLSEVSHNTKQSLVNEQDVIFPKTQNDVLISKGEFKSTDLEKTEIANAPIKFESKEIIEAPKTNDELATDYQYIRTNIYSITEMSIQALNNLVQIADQSQHPRAYEVVGLLVNSIASAQRDLMNMHKERHKIQGIQNKNSPEIVNNNLFVGNTAELDQIIAKMTKKSEK